MTLNMFVPYLCFVSVTSLVVGPSEIRVLYLLFEELIEIVRAVFVVPVVVEIIHYGFQTMICQA